MNKKYYSNELYHFGVKGMKWGEWNDETRARYTGKRANKEPTKKKATNNPHKMTDNELADRIKRLKKEAEYRDLKKKTEPGKVYVEQILGDIGKRVIVTASAGALLYGLKSALGGQFDADGLASAVFNGGAKKK